MKDWDDRVAEFLKSHEEGEELDREDFLEFVEKGLKPLVEEHVALRKATTDLVETNLSIFKQVIVNPNQKMKNSKLYHNICTILKILQDPKDLQ